VIPRQDRAVTDSIFALAGRTKLFSAWQIKVFPVHLREVIEIYVTISILLKVNIFPLDVATPGGVFPSQFLISSLFPELILETDANRKVVVNAASEHQYSQP
jgi:hypothetical protein